MTVSSVGDRDNVTRIKGVDLPEPQEMTDEVLEDTMCETVRPWEDQWKSLKVNESKIGNQRWTIKIDKHDLEDTDWTDSLSMKRNT